MASRIADLMRKSGTPVGVQGKASALDTTGLDMVIQVGVAGKVAEPVKTPPGTILVW